MSKQSLAILWALSLLVALTGGFVAGRFSALATTAGVGGLSIERDGSPPAGASTREGEASARRERTGTPEASGAFVPLAEAWLPVKVVADGDTLEVVHAGKTVRVRLFGVDCPELSQAYGEEAKAFTRDFLRDQEVQIHTVDTDRYGRTIADVVLRDGRSLNQELVKTGHAWWYRRYSDDPELGRLESDARREKRGLWADDKAQPPWDYRVQHDVGRNRQ